MPLYVADYLADTSHLNAAEHGAYLLLIMHYWQKGGLPNDEQLLCRIARMQPDEWARSRSIIAEFFDESWRHHRIDAELAKAEDISSKRAEAARQRKSKSSPNAEQEQSNCSTIEDTRARVSQSQSQSQDSSSLRSDENNTPRRIASRKADAIRECLEAVLEPEIAIGVIDHRRGLRKPLTLLAAQGLAKAFAATSDPNSAARTMIERGWQGFQPEWLENHGVPNGHGRPPTRAGPTTGQLMMEAVQGKFTEGLIRDGYVAAEDRTGTAGIAERDRQSGD